MYHLRIHFGKPQNLFIIFELNFGKDITVFISGTLLILNFMRIFSNLDMLYIRQAYCKEEALRIHHTLVYDKMRKICSSFQDVKGEAAKQ